MVLNNRLLRVLGVVVVLAIVGAALWFIARQLGKQQWSHIWLALGEITWLQLWLAVGWTVARYAVAAVYDGLALWYLGFRLPVSQIALVSFGPRAVAATFGSVFAGNPIRYRLLRTHGLTLTQIVAAITMMLSTWWVGFVAVAGVVWIVVAVPLPPQLDLPLVSLPGVGVVLLIGIAFYLWMTMHKNAVIRWQGREIRPPSARVTLVQFAIVAVDVCTSAAALYVLLPPSIGTSFPTMIAIYLLTALFSFISRAPGGIGVFELAVITLMNVPEEQSPALIATLLAFRAIHFLLPLAPAAVLLAGNELLLQHARLRRCKQPPAGGGGHDQQPENPSVP